ncbi:MAG: hypothetical protein J6X84_04375 [Treponema sp.]|nr:hypothetical protein [Treponema sp.]
MRILNKAFHSFLRNNEYRSSSSKKRLANFFERTSTIAFLQLGLLITIPNALISCSKNDSQKNQSSANQTAVVSEPQNNVTEQKNTGSQAAPATASAALPSTTPDLDLTKMSATMIYSTIFDMLIMPEDYMEKNIKLKGWFETYIDPETAKMYYAVIVPDATACCQQGLEFKWPGQHRYPADFPNPGEDITITGYYKLYEENGITYSYIEATSVEF